MDIDISDLERAVAESKTDIRDLDRAVAESKTDTRDIEEILAKADWVERLHPRDNDGQFTSSGSGGSDTEVRASIAADTQRKILFGDHAGTPDDPVPCGDDIERAAKVIHEGGNVKLDQPDQVATLLDKLRDIAKDAEAKGEKAPLYDLCKVSVPGTNLFCQDAVTGRDREGNPTKISRVQMPQFSTTDPIPGSAADKAPRNAKGEVNLSEQFAEHLASSGVGTHTTTIDASHLRASQNELNGAKVAGIAGAIDAGKIDPTDPKNAIYVTRDNYVIDGHHRWAANVAKQYTSGETIEMPVIVVDMDIGSALTVANYWTDQMGIPPADASKKGADPWLYRTMTRVPEMADVISKFAEDQPRDEDGRWIEAGGVSSIPGVTAGNPGTPTAMVNWTRFDTAEQRLSDARKYEGEHVIVDLRKRQPGGAPAGTLHVTDSAFEVGGRTFDPEDIRGLAVYGNWAKAFDPAEHPRDDHGRFADVPGGGNPLVGAAETPRDEPRSSNVEPRGEIQASDPDDAWSKLDADRFDRQEQEKAHPENYEPNRGYGTHLKLGATEWRRDVSEDGVPTVYQVIGTDSRTVPLEVWGPQNPAAMPMESPTGVPIVVLRVDGSEKPDPFVYRVMSVGEFEQARERGYFQSDQSMNLADEGTVASRGSTGTFYVPVHGEDFRIVQLDMDPDDGWKVDTDGYVKTHARVLFSRARAYSTPLANPRASKAFDPSEHPRDSHGRFTEGAGGSSNITGNAIAGATTPDNYRETWLPTMSPEDGHAWAKAAGTKFPQTVVHMTSAVAVDGIKGQGFHAAEQAVHEAGIYFALRPTDAEFYTYKGSRAVSTIVVTHTPLELNWTEREKISDVAREGDFRGAALEAAGYDLHEPQTILDAIQNDPELRGEAADMRAAIAAAAQSFHNDSSRTAILHDAVRYATGRAAVTTAAIRAKGYDSVIIRPLWDPDTDPTTGGQQIIVFDKEQAVVIGTEEVYYPGADEAIARAFAKFDEQLHPRDSHGRFAETPSGGVAVAEDEFTELPDEEFKSQFNAGRSNATWDQKSAMEDYTGSGYYNINGALREGAKLSPDDPTQHAIDGLDGYTHTQSLAHDTLLFRMGGKTPEQYVPTEVGARFRDRAFISTSSVREMYPVIGKQQGITIQTPAGTPFGFGSFGERELILPRDTEFEVVSSEDRGQFVTLRVAGP